MKIQLRLKLYIPLLEAPSYEIRHLRYTPM